MPARTCATSSAWSRRPKKNVKLRVAAGFEVGQVRKLLCLLRVQKERSDELYVHQGKHCRQA